MTDLTPNQRMAKGFADNAGEDIITAAKAVGHNPDGDALASRMTALGDRLSPSQRMALGYHNSAADAAKTLADKDK